MKRQSIVLALLLLSAPLFAQRMERGMERDREERAQQFFFYETLPLSVDGKGTTRLAIPYRIDWSFFVAMRSKDNPPGQPFLKRGEVLFELMDSTGTSAGRSIQEITIPVPTSEQNPPGHSWFQGIATLSVPPGEYRILAELSDLQSQRDYSEKHRIVRIASAPDTGLAAAPFFFAAGLLPSAIPDTLTLENLGGNIRFGASGYAVVQLFGGDDTAGIKVDYLLEIENREEESRQEYRRVSAAPVLVRPHAGLQPAGDSSAVGFVVTGPGKGTLVAVSVPVEELPLRDYSLTINVRRGSHTTTVKHRFRTVWPDMPVSLRDVDMALDALRFLVSEDRLDQMRRGDFESRRDSLEAFWKARDRTPRTAYNELMAEYYRRVDFAMRTYASLRQPDGTRTDRGKVYIVYGSPSSTERSLKTSGAHLEIWKYDRLGKTFVFEDLNRTGNYVLVTPAGS